MITFAKYTWNGHKYILEKEISHIYFGPLIKLCGATSEQKDIQSSQISFFNTLQQQLQQVFGQSSNVFKDLYNAYAPIVAAGPSQKGFSPAEEAALKSQAITGTGQAYESARQRVGENIAAAGGGNYFLPTGAAIGAQTALSSASAAETARELTGIQLQNYATGRSNWINAARGLAGAPSVFNPSTGIAGVGVGAGNAAANTANQIAQEQNSWVNALIGAGAGIAGGMFGGLSGSGGSGGGSGSTAAFPGMTPGQISASFGGPSEAETVG